MEIPGEEVRRMGTRKRRYRIEITRYGTPSISGACSTPRTAYAAGSTHHITPLSHAKRGACGTAHTASGTRHSTPCNSLGCSAREDALPSLSGHARSRAVWPSGKATAMAGQIRGRESEQLSRRATQKGAAARSRVSSWADAEDDDAVCDQR